MAADVRLVIGPNASLDRRGAIVFMGVLVATAMGVGGLCVSRGLWPVLPFSALELVAVGAALVVCLRRHRYREVVELTESRLRIQFGLIGRGASSVVRCRWAGHMSRCRPQSAAMTPRCYASAARSVRGWMRFAVFGASALVSSAARSYTGAKWNLPQGVTEISHDVYRLHMMVFWICVVIGTGVFGAMFYSVLAHRKSRGATAAQFHESTTVKILWTAVPFVILICMAVPAAATLIRMSDSASCRPTRQVKACSTRRLRLESRTRKKPPFSKAATMASRNAMIRIFGSMTATPESDAAIIRRGRVDGTASERLGNAG